MQHTLAGHRLQFLDTLRGISFLSMALFHFTWNLVNIFGVSIPMFGGMFQLIWRSTICYTFLIIGGFCYSFSRNHLRHFVILCGASLGIFFMTTIALPEDAISFGIIFLNASCTLLLMCLEKPLLQISPKLGMGLAAMLFCITYSVPEGAIGFMGMPIITLPDAMYQYTALSPLGFPSAAFQSSDYYPILPWLFLYLFGFFLFQHYKECGRYPSILYRGVPWLSFLGRHASLLYLLHQPILYGLQTLFFLNCAI